VQVQRTHIDLPDNLRLPDECVCNTSGKDAWLFELSTGHCASIAPFYDSIRVRARWMFFFVSSRCESLRTRLPGVFDLWMLLEPQRSGQPFVFHDTDDDVLIGVLPPRLEREHLVSKFSQGEFPSCIRQEGE